jgi:prepilin-type N-terminal cleavage/methylation domain-containing protein
VRRRNGFTLIELLIVMAIVAVLMAIGMALHRRSRLRGAETAAISALEAVNQAQFAYMQTCGNQRYASSLAELGKPLEQTGAAYLSPDMTVEGESLRKSGYIFRMGGTEVTDGSQTCTGSTPMTGYYLTADPEIPGVTGERFFGTNTDRVIFEDSETFVSRMPESGPPAGGVELLQRGRAAKP